MNESETETEIKFDETVMNNTDTKPSGLTPLISDGNVISDDDDDGGEIEMQLQQHTTSFNIKNIEITGNDNELGNEIPTSGGDLNAAKSAASVSRMGSANINYVMQKMRIDDTRKHSLSARIINKYGLNQDTSNPYDITINPCYMGKMGSIEITSNTIGALFKWLLICFIRAIISIFFWWLICIFIFRYCIFIFGKIRQYKRTHKNMKEYICTRFVINISLAFSMYYWHFWASYSLVRSIIVKRNPFIIDLVSVYFMELCFEWILARIVGIITYNNKYHFIVAAFNNTLHPLLYKEVCIGTPIKTLLPHKFSHQLVSYKYLNYAGLRFTTDVDTQVSAEALVKFIEKRQNNKSKKLDYLILGTMVLLGISIIWVGYEFYDYDYTTDSVIFTIWLGYFTYLLWTYFQIHLSSQFFIYLDQMKLLTTVININFKELTNEFIKYNNQNDPKVNGVHANDDAKENGINSGNKEFTQDKATFLLSESNNISVWYDVWSEVRRNSRDYFDQQKYFIFVIFTLLLFSISFGIIRIFTDRLDFDQDIVAKYGDIHIVFIGAPALIFTILGVIMFAILIYLSFQFPKTQRQQIRSLNDQYYYICDICSQIKYKMLKTYHVIKNNDKTDPTNTYRNNLIEYFKEIKDQLNVVQTGIKIKKISPKIAGLSMDHFLIRLFWTFVVFIGSTILVEVGILNN